MVKDLAYTNARLVGAHQHFERTLRCGQKASLNQRDLRAVREYLSTQQIINDSDAEKGSLLALMFAKRQ